MEDKHELRNKYDLSNMGYGLKSPQDTELEKTLLVGCIGSPEYSILMVTMLEEDDFYKPEHRIIYRAIRSLIDNGMVADLISVSSKLNGSDEEWGGISYIMGGAYFPSDRLETYCKIIKDKSLKRQYIRSYSVGISKCFEDEMLADEISNTIISETNKNLNEKKQATNEEDSTQIYKEAIGEVQAGIEFTPFKKFNEKVRCRKGDLVVIAGRPSMGKSMMATTVLNEFINQDMKGVFWGLEMMNKDNKKRLLCCRYSIDFKQMMKGELKPSKELDDALDSMLEVTKDKVAFIDQTGVNALAIKSRLMMLKAEMGIEFAIIDYGGLMSHNLGNKNLTKSDQIGETTKAMKEIAKELDIVLVFLWQVGRPQKGQAIRPPSLSDLKHSGSLEEDADIVVFIHREAYYADINKEGANPKTLVKTAKHRNGEVGIEYCNSDFQYARFVDMDNSDIVSNENKKENNQIEVPF